MTTTEKVTNKFKLITHTKNYGETDDVILNLKGFDPTIKEKDVLEVYHPEALTLRLLIQVPILKDEVNVPKDTISIEQSIAQNFQLRPFKDVIVNKVNPKDVALDWIELTFKDQYIGRSEMWRIKRKLVDSVVQINKKIEFCSNIRCHVYEMSSKGNRVASGVIVKDTKIVFRSSTSKVYLFIQMSSEMWDFDITGDLYFELAVNGFLTELFAKWKAAGSNHEVTIVLFSRTFYEASDIKDFSRCMHECLRVDHQGRFYKDFYYVVVQKQKHDDWTHVLSLLRRIFYSYLDMVLKHHEKLGEDVPKATNSCASKGNFMEVLNMSLNVFEKHFIDRQFDRTGQVSVVITPGVGMFEVDRALANMTKQRINDSGVSSDLVCIGRQPLHAVPLLKHSSVDYSIPDTWINLSYYDSNKRIGYGTFTPQIQVPLEYCEPFTTMTGEATKSIYPVLKPVPRKFNFEFTCDRTPYEEYDKDCFKLPTKLSYDSYTPAHRKGPTQCSSYPYSTKHHTRSASDSNIQCETAEQAQASTSKAEPQRIGLINPFIPVGTTRRPSSNRQRWLHVFPEEIDNIFSQHQYYEAHSSEFCEPESDSKSSTLALSNIDEAAFAVRKGVHWKSLVLPACLPLTSNFFPDDSTLESEFEAVEYTFSPHESRLNEFFLELVSIRLGQGLQLAPFVIELREAISVVLGKGSRALSSLRQQNTNNEPTEYRLTIGQSYHKILLNVNDCTTKVIVYKQKQATRYLEQFDTPYVYKYLLHAPNMDDYQCSCVHFRTERKENYKWNHLDNYVYFKGEVSDCLENESYDLKFWKLRLVLFPDFGKVIKAKAATDQYFGVYFNFSAEEQKAIVDRFLKFFEVVHRIKRLPADMCAERGSSYSSGGRSSEKKSKLSGRLPEIQKLEINTSVPEEQDGNAENTETGSQSDEESASASSLQPSSSEILDLMCHQERGIAFLPAETGLPSQTFISGDAVAWLIRTVEAVVSETTAVEIFQNMVNEKLICHASGRQLEFINGFYLFCVMQDNIEINHSFEQEWHEVAIDPIILTAPVEGTAPIFLSPNLPSQSILNTQKCKYKMGKLEVDINKKSDRSEWGHMIYCTKFSPTMAYEMSIQWMVATASLVSDLLLSWQRKAQNLSLHLFAVPSEIFPHDSLYGNPMRYPILIDLNIACLKDLALFDDSSDSFKQRIHLLQESIMERFGFLPYISDQVGQKEQYIHVTGSLFAMIHPSFYESNSEEPLQPAFLWSSNYMLTRRWRVPMLDEFFSEDLLQEFKEFCANANDLLKSFCM